MNVKFINKLKHIWSTLRSSFWFLPSLIVAGSIAVALTLIQIDTGDSQQWMARWPRLFGASAAGTRGVLSTIAGSMMTVVGVTFSMVLVTLTLASSLYSSRILRNFMRDHVTQVVLGIFAGIFTYCLIVLRTIRGGDEFGFIPSMASKNIPSAHRYEEGELRVIAIGPTFASLVGEAFNQIRGSANDNVAIMLRMLDALQTIASLTANPVRRQTLREQVLWIAEAAERTIKSPHDLARAESRLAVARSALETEPVQSTQEQSTKVK